MPLPERSAGPILALIAGALICAGCADMGSTPAGIDNGNPPLNLTPTIHSVVPDLGGVGDTVLVKGKEFGDSRGAGEVLFGDLPAIIAVWSDSAIIAIVPSIHQSVLLSVRIDEIESAPTPFSLTGDIAPLIISIDPPAALPGETIAISGLRFGDSSGAVIFFNNHDGSDGIVSWSDSLVRVSVPAGAASGGMTIRADSLEGAEFHFDVIPPLPLPSLSSIIPERTIQGDTVWIRGGPFGTDRAFRVVGFTPSSGEAPFTGADLISWTDSLLVAVVPDNAATGTIAIYFPSGSRTGNSLPFGLAQREVTWSDAENIFARSCRSSGCHGSAPFANGWSAASYSGVLSGMSVNGPVVLPRRSADSYLIRVLQAPQPGTVPVRMMPLEAPPLSPSDISLLADWIDQGIRE